jgi:hypothetical protein
MQWDLTDRIAKTERMDKKISEASCALDRPKSVSPKAAPAASCGRVLPRLAGDRREIKGTEDLLF